MDLGRPVEVSAQILRGRSDGEWNTFVAPKFKTNLIPTAIGQWGVAIAGGAVYDAVEKDLAGFFAYVPATFRVSNVMRINVNAGWAWDRLADIHYATYAAGIDWRTPDNVWTLTAEVFGLVGQADTATEKQPRFQLGLRWRPVDRFSMDRDLRPQYPWRERKLDHAWHQHSLSGRGSIKQEWGISLTPVLA